MIKIKCHPHRSKIGIPTANTIDVLQFGTRYSSKSGYAIGNLINDKISRLGFSVSQQAVDFLSIAMGVTAADTFIRRDTSADGWCRDIHLEVSVYDKPLWESVKEELEVALNFLSGDMWRLSFMEGGIKPPYPYMQPTRARLVHILGSDSVCLFSGGLDSTIGAIELIQNKRRPVLVSHSYCKDKAIQLKVHKHLPVKLPLFAACLNPASPLPAETSMRSRSFNFIAYGTIVASALSILNGSEIPLYIPENGFIALNAPLTTRRIGSLSTRTTHPYFVNSIQKIFEKVGIPVKIENPYEHLTKGEMLVRNLHDKTLAQVSPITVSCGKWKRKNMQCGRCVPCIIRRASFHAAGVGDDTLYRDADLQRVFKYEQDRDDVLAMLLASKNGTHKNHQTWVSLSGPLPENNAPYVDVFKRGLAEVRNFLENEGFHI